MTVGIDFDNIASQQPPLPTILTKLIFGDKVTLMALLMLPFPTEVRMTVSY